MAQKPLPSRSGMLLLDRTCLSPSEEQGYELIAGFPVTHITNNN